MKKLILLLALTLLTACSSYQAFREGEKAEQDENYDRAVAKYMEALSRDPDNVRYKIYLERVRLRASQAHFEKAKKLHEAGKLRSAILEYQMAVQLDPTNEYAQVELKKALKAQKEKNTALSDLEVLKQKAMSSGQPPKLNPKSREPMAFSFPKPTEVKDIYKAFAKAFGFNIIYDPQIKEKKITLELKEVTSEKALEITMRSAGHFYKVIDETTIIIAPDTPQMRKEYEDLLIQTFYLSNADVKDVNNILRSIMQARNVATNQQLNAVVIRDTADKVAIAKRIIEANDKSKAEVIIDVELMQVDTSKFKEIGANLSNYSYTLGYNTGTETGTISIGDLSSIYHDDWNVAIPSITLSLVKNASEAELLAKPQLRISEGEKAQLHIGDRIPIATAQFSGYQQTGGTTGYGAMPYRSYQYTDVGIKIDIEPRVHHNREVTLKLKVEVSSVAPSSGGDGDYLPPTISTRTINSVIRLKDGESNLLAGLIRNDRSMSKSGFPWLQEIPLIGSLFSNSTRNLKRTDLMLTLTPHIIRMPDITEKDLIPVWVGTEKNMSIRGESPRLESGREGPFDHGRPAPESGQEEKDHGRKPFNRDNMQFRNIKQPPGAPGQKITHEEESHSVPRFQMIADPSGPIDSGIQTYTLYGEYDEEKRMGSFLIEMKGPIRFQGIEGIGDVESVVNPVSDTQVRVDLLLPQPPPIDGNLAILTFEATGQGSTEATIIKGGCRDEHDNLWPITTAGFTLP